MGLCITELIHQLLEDVQPHDRVRLTLNSTRLDHEIWLPFMKSTELTADRVMVEAERVMQSKKEWVLEGSIHVQFIHAPLPVGGGRLKHIANLERYLAKKRCIISIPRSADNICCARAIVTAKARLDKHPMWNSIRAGRQIQSDMALELQRNAGIPCGVLCGKPQWDRFQQALGCQYELIIISRDFFNAIVYNSQTKGPKKIILYHAENHFSVITSMTAFMGRCYYCSSCNTSYNNPSGHRCAKRCSKCNDATPCDFQTLSAVII